MGAGRPVWSVEKDHATVGLYAVERFTDDVVLLFGSERAWLPRTLIEHAMQPASAGPRRGYGRARLRLGSCPAAPPHRRGHSNGGLPP